MTNSTWEEYRIAVVESLERLEKDIKEIKAEMKSLEAQMNKIDKRIALANLNQKWVNLILALSGGAVGGAAVDAIGISNIIKIVGG